MLRPFAAYSRTNAARLPVTPGRSPSLRLLASRAHEVVAVLDQVADERVGRIRAEGHRDPVALVEVVAGDDRIVPRAQEFPDLRLALEADVQRVGRQRRDREDLAADLEH